MLDMLAADGVEESVEDDRLGGNAPLSTSVYDGIIQYVYLEKTSAGAMMAYMSFLPESAGRAVIMRECIMSCKSGTPTPTYTDKKTGKKRFLPGYERFLSAYRLLVDKDVKDLSGAEADKKVLKLWDKETMKDTNQEKVVLVEFTNMRCKAAITHVIDDKTKKNESTGKYDPTGETSEFNEIAKLFNTDDRTVSEVIKASEPAFKAEWLERYKGEVLNRAKGAKGNPAAGARAGAPAAAAGSTAPVINLF